MSSNSRKMRSVKMMLQGTNLISGKGPARFHLLWPSSPDWGIRKANARCMLHPHTVLRRNGISQPPQDCWYCPWWYLLMSEPKWTVLLSNLRNDQGVTIGKGQEAWHGQNLKVQTRVYTYVQWKYKGDKLWGARTRWQYSYFSIFLLHTVKDSENSGLSNLLNV